MPNVSLRMSEPANPRYVYINPTTNTVHLLVPITTGTNIALDNTCKTVLALQEFFGKRSDSDASQNSAKYELVRFKEALEQDILALDDGALKQQKIVRLQQVNTYIDALSRMENDPSLNSLRGGFPTYPEPVNAVLRKPESNLYAMHLRPTHQDGFLRTQNPVFTMNRTSPSGTFYHALMGLSVARINATTHKDRFINRVKQSFPDLTFPMNANQGFTEISKRLSQIYHEMFPTAPDLNFLFDEATKQILGYDDNATIDSLPEFQGLIDNRARVEDTNFPMESSFFELHVPVVQEKLSIMTQFFMGEINIFARANGLSSANFGQVLDGNHRLAQSLAQCVKNALEQGHPVESSVCDFVNAHYKEFSLSRILTNPEKERVSTQFNLHYQSVKESMHMDEFMVMDPDHAARGHIVTHQGSLCFDFSELAPDIDRAKREIPNTPAIVPNRSGEAVGSIEVDEDALKASLIGAILNDKFSEARKILSRMEDGRCLFEELGRDFFSQFDGNFKAQELLLQVRRGITDAAISNRFNQIVRGQDAQLVLTPEMARTLYVTVAATKPLDPKRTLKYSTNEDILALLGDLGITGNLTITPNYNNDMVIDATTDIIRNISGIVNNPLYQNAIHLTNSMAASLYKQVEANFGATSQEVNEMMTLNNRGVTPEKLIKALSLLDINIDPNQIQYPNEGRGTNGYIISNISLDSLRTITEIHATQGHRFSLDESQLARLYAFINENAPPDLQSAVGNLPRTRAGISCAFMLLNINLSRVDTDDDGGLVLFLPELEQAKLKVVLRMGLNDQERSLVQGFQPTISQPRGKAMRGFMGMLQHMARMREQERSAPSREAPIRTRPTPPEAPPGAVSTSASSSPPPSAPMRFGHSPAATPSAATPPATPQVLISRVAGFASVSNTVPPRIHPEHAQLNCPDRILQAFKDTLRGTPILGARFVNPYTGQNEQFPVNVDDLTARHLQILARNEPANTTGTMRFQQYSGLLNENQIAKIRALVKATTVSGLTYAERVGGYNSTPTPLNPHHKVIVIDQSGFQWQRDVRNTGGLFFYPNPGQNPPVGYSAWQQDTYRAMFGAERPAASSANAIGFNWNGIQGQLDLNGVALGIEREFSQALSAAIAQGDNLDPLERINFAFLKAGMGFFADQVPVALKPRLEAARLQGILNTLNRLSSIPEPQRRAMFGKVGRIELPFSGSSDPTQQTLLRQIESVVQQMGLEWGGTQNQGGYVLRPGWVTATTNCADPHAMTSNEGGYQSVDAEMARNAYLDHLNAGNNVQMILRVTQSDYPVIPDMAAAAVAPAASSAPSAPSASSASSASAAISSSSSSVISRVDSLPLVIENRLRDKLGELLENMHSSGITLSRGRWRLIEDTMELGISNHSGELCLATPDYQISFKNERGQDCPLIVRDKHAGYAVVSAENVVSVLQSFSRVLGLDSQPVMDEEHSSPSISMSSSSSSVSEPTSSSSPPSLSNRAELERALRAEIDRLVANMHFSRTRGNWQRVGEGIQLGYSRSSGELSLATRDYQIAFQNERGQDHPLIVRNKTSGYTEVSNESDVIRILNDFCQKLRIDVQSTLSVERGASSSVSASAIDESSISSHFSTSLEASSSSSSSASSEAAGTVSSLLNINEMLNNLISDLNSKSTIRGFFTESSDNKARMLEQVRTWLTQHPPLGLGEKIPLLALIRDICAIKRSTFAFLSGDSRSTQVFNEWIRRDPSIDLGALSRVTYPREEINESLREGGRGVELLVRSKQLSEGMTPPPPHDVGPR